MADVLACDEILERSTSNYGKRKRGEEDPTSRLIVERRANAALAAELAAKALDALVALDALEEEFQGDGDDDALFVDREERHFLQDAQRVANDIRERALDYVGERPPNSP